MTGLLVAILVGLVVNLIWLAANFIWGRTSRLRTINSTRRFWHPLRPDSRVHVTASLVPTQATTKEYRRPATGLGELQAYAYVHESLFSAGLASSIVGVSMSDALPSEAYRRDIVTIGGSQLNQVTGLFLEHTNIAFQVLNDPPKRVVDLERGEEFRPKLEKHSILVDYGIITHIKNPFEKHSRVLVLQGAHTFGTAACGRILTADYISHLNKAVHSIKGDNWQAVVRCVVRGHEVLPEVVAIRAVALKSESYSEMPPSIGSALQNRQTG